MKPYVPELMVFVSPDKKMEIHSPMGNNAFLIRKDGKKETKFQWQDRFYPAFVFSAPSSQKIISLGGLGDPGVDLGVIEIYEDNGLIKAIDLKKDIPDLEELSRADREMTNFPWITSVDLDSEKLQIWICGKVLAVLSLNDLKVTTNRLKQAPAWSGAQVSTQAEKFRWETENRD